MLNNSLKRFCDLNRSGLCSLKTLYFICLWIHTFDLQLAGDCGLSLGVLGYAGVHTAIKGAGLADLEGANPLVRDLTKLGVVTNDHPILQPLDLWLRERGETFISYSIPQLYHPCIVVVSLSAHVDVWKIYSLTFL